ncbi:MAG: PD-(D/E)XK nuclease-like domain-containing protein [Candidatus Competibacteraceae bacterium]|nr:PD-(D/E)XK nuclease-like domain-containing protein [Candidatus Competibacteraceae bacterium]
MNNRQYQDIPAISSHRLIAMLESPAHCWRKYLDPDRKAEAPSDALKLGTLVHCLTLNPHDFDNEFLVADYERRSKAGKARYAELNQYGLTVIKPAELERAQAIADALQYDNDARKLLRYGRKERTIVKPRAAGLLPLKARLDIHNEAKRQVIELKTTRDSATIQKTIADYHYLLSAAFYQDISQSHSVVFIFVESAEPYRIEIFEPAYGQLDQGRELMAIKLQQFDECWLANHWPEAPPTPELEDDPLFMPMPLMTAKPNLPRFEIEVGELAL